MHATRPWADSRRSGPGVTAQARRQIPSRVAGKRRKSPPSAQLRPGRELDTGLQAATSSEDCSPFRFPTCCLSWKAHLSAWCCPCFPLPFSAPLQSVVSTNRPSIVRKAGRLYLGAMPTDTRNANRQHRPGFDITFSAPHPCRCPAVRAAAYRVVLRGHIEAVNATWDWIEATRYPRRRGYPLRQYLGPARSTFRYPPSVGERTAKRLCIGSVRQGLAAVFRLECSQGHADRVEGEGGDPPPARAASRSA